MLGVFMIGGGEILLLLFMLIVAPLCLLVTVFWVWMLVHVVTNKGLNDTEKIMWVLIIVFVHLVGALIYFFVGRPKAAAAPG